MNGDSRPGTNPDHPGDVRISQRTVLHFDPEEVKTSTGHRAVDIWIRSADRASDYLFAVRQFLFYRVEHHTIGLTRLRLGYCHSHKNDDRYPYRRTRSLHS